MEEALDRAAHALFAAGERDLAQGGDGLLGDALDTALALWLLADQPALLRAIGAGRAAAAVEASSERASTAVRSLLDRAAPREMPLAA